MARYLIFLLCSCKIVVVSSYDAGTREDTTVVCPHCPCDDRCIEGCLRRAVKAETAEDNCLKYRKEEVEKLEDEWREKLNVCEAEKNELSSKLNQSCGEQPLSTEDSSTSSALNFQ